MSIMIPHREPNGRHKRKALTLEERERIGVGLAQPHRKGSRFPEHEWRCELFGRLILDNGWGFENGKQMRHGPADLWNAGNRFKGEYQGWQRAKASRRAWAKEDRPRIGTVDDVEAAMRAEQAILRYHGSLRVFSAIPARCYEAAVNVILTDQPEDWYPAHGVVESTYDALWALAEMYGR